MRQVHLDKAIDILGKMIDPPDDGWEFLEMWESDPGIVDAVRKQIGELRIRRSEIAS